jgi:hypothetical protein
VLDHRRGVAEGEAGQLGAPGVVVQLGMVGLADQEVVQQLAPGGRVGQVEVEPAVEAARPQQCRVQRLRPVGGGDHQQVVVAQRRFAELPPGGQPAVEPVDQPAGDPLAQRRAVEALQLDQQLVDHPPVPALTGPSPPSMPPGARRSRRSPR